MDCCLCCAEITGSFKIKSILEDNNIISRVRQGCDSSEEEGTCYEIMVPAGEISLAQDLILEFEM